MHETHCDITFKLYHHQQREVKNCWGAHQPTDRQDGKAKKKKKMYNKMNARLKVK